MISVLLAVKAELSANQFLPEAVGTVLSQSHADWELLIGVNCDDETETFAEASKWAVADQRIQVHSMPTIHNRGDAMNSLLELSCGDAIAALDVDDLWHPLKLERQLPFIDRYTVVGTLGCYFGSRYQDIEVPPGPIDKKQFLVINPILHASAIIQRPFARWVVSDNRLIPTDYVRWLDMAANGSTFYNVPEMLTFIRIHEDRWSARYDTRAIITKLQENYAAKLQ